MDIAEEIKSRCNIVDVIGRQVELRKTGSVHVGLCPFHREKTPSFTVSEDRQNFNCYGCGTGGDVIKFVQLTQNMSFMEAAEKLADEYGIELAHDTKGGVKKDIYYAANKTAAIFFYNALRKRGNPALYYMAGRGIEARTIKDFGIGYADEEWDSLYKELLARGVDTKIMAELGLISNSKGKYFDKYRGRVIFPIKNTRGLVIAFGGRLLGDGQPKYLNSQDSRVFHKKDNLYALNITRQDITKQDQAILVEGYMDVISLYQSGVKNVTASLGTALTAEQAAIIKRYTSNVVIAYDSDQAGVKAALRGIDLLKKAGCSVKVLKLEGAKDPDEYIKAEGRERFLRLVEEAPTHIKFKLDLAKENNDIGSTEGRIGFLRDAAKILRSVSPVEADIYIRTTASEMNISEGALRAEVLGMTGGNYNSDAKVSSNNISLGERAKTQSTHAAAGGSMLEKNFIRLILLNSRYFLEIKKYEHVFTAPAIQRIYEGITSLYEDDAEIDLKKLEDALDASDRRVLSDIMDNIRLSDQDEAVFDECVKTARLLELTEREEGIIALLNGSDGEGEENRGRVRELTEELLKIQKDIKVVKEGR